MVEGMNETQNDSMMETLQRLADQKIKWHWQPTMIAGLETRLAVASDPDGMLIEACERQDAGEEGVIDPFWATTWRAASGLDRYLDRLDLQDLRVLELGCGTGHAGLAAAMRSANVVMTDGVDDPLLLVRMSTLHLAERCHVQRLRFGIDRIEGPKFPLILGSDVTYLRVLWPQLDQCLRDHLAGDGEVLLSDPYRIIADEFRGWIQSHGWNYTEHRIDLEDDREHPIRVMQLSLPG